MEAAVFSAHADFQESDGNDFLRMIVHCSSIEEVLRMLLPDLDLKLSGF